MINRPVKYYFPSATTLAMATAFLTSSLLTSCTRSEKKNTDEAISADTVAVSVDSTAFLDSQANAGPFLEVLPASEGMVAVRNESGWGFMDEAGNMIINCQYEGVGTFENGKAVVKTNLGDWRKSFVYIDKQGKEAGLFFDVKQTGSCEAIRIIINNLDGESLSTDHLSRCPGGIISCENQGWEWGSVDSFFPNETIEQQIQRYRESSKDEYSTAFNKFKGESTAFDDGGYKVSITVEKNPEGVITKLVLDKSSDSDGSNLELNLAEGGVMTSRSYGS